MAADGQPVEVSELLGMLGVASLSEWLELPELYSAEQARHSLSSQLRWAQARLNNPRYGTLAHHMLRHKGSLERVLVSRASQIELKAPPEPEPEPELKPEPAPPVLPENLPERTPEECLRDFWEGLKLARGLSSDQRMRLLGREARRLGVSLSETQSLIAVPFPEVRERPVRREVPAAHRVERLRPPAPVPPSAKESTRSRPSTASRSRELARRGREREQDRRLPKERRSEALVELAEGFRGLMLQGLLQPSAQETLVRQAYRGGLAPNRARAAIMRATEQWRTYRAGLHDPHLQLGWEPGRPRRADYLARRRLLLNTMETWSDLEELLALDAAYASLQG